MPSECFGTCCVRAAVCPLTCQFAVELLQEAGLSGVEGQKNKADWVGTRLMSGLCLCGGGRKKKGGGSICMKRGLRVHAPRDSLGSETPRRWTQVYQPRSSAHMHVTGCRVQMEAFRYTNRQQGCMAVPLNAPPCQRRRPRRQDRHNDDSSLVLD